MPQPLTEAQRRELPRRTKIVATIGPATDAEQILDRLIGAGVDVFRLNMAHAPHEDVRRQVETIRRLADRRDRSVAILMDTQGPAIRTGDLSAELNLRPGDRIALTVRGEVSEEMHSVDVNYEELVNDIGVGDVVLVDNGNIKLKVLEKHDNHLECEVLTEGRLGSRRHINLPGVRVNLPALTEKDLRDVELGIELGVDLIAMSFVREASDIQRLRDVLEGRGARQKIVAKLEDQQGVTNLEAIVDAADGVMIARGDLGIEVPYEELPPLQRRVVKTCMIRGCPVIVATHMLESMIENPSPTRAEVTDVANAVYEQADAIMLSGETSVGRYPVECVHVMDRIARRIERSGGAGFAELFASDEMGAHLSRSASPLAESIGAAAIVVFTRTGNMPRFASTTRPLHTPIYAFTPHDWLCRQIPLHWGVRPFTIGFDDDADTDETVKRAGQTLVDEGLVGKGETVVFIAEARIRGKTIDTIQVEQVG